MIIRILLLILLIPFIIIFVAFLVHIAPLPYYLDDSREIIAAALAGIISFI